MFENGNDFDFKSKSQSNDFLLKSIDFFESLLEISAACSLFGVNTGGVCLSFAASNCVPS
jgi:hypothetical protein